MFRVETAMRAPADLRERTSQGWAVSSQPAGRGIPEKEIFLGVQPFADIAEFA